METGRSNKGWEMEPTASLIQPAGRTLPAPALGPLDLWSAVSILYIDIPGICNQGAMRSFEGHHEV